jgi:hypothetical protein
MKEKHKQSLEVPIKPFSEGITENTTTIQK